MKEERLLKEQLLNKFDELPVRGQAEGDWLKLQKALNVAMPVGALSLLLLYGKAWFAKKLSWLYLLGLGATGGAALIIYYPAQPKNDAAPIIARDSVIAKQDTTHSKSKTLRPAAIHDTPVHKRKVTPTVNLKDTTIFINKTPATMAVKDSVIRRYKKVPSIAQKDTLTRKHKTLSPTGMKDTTTRKHKKPPPPGT